MNDKIDTLDQAKTLWRKFEKQLASRISARELQREQSYFKKKEEKAAASPIAFKTDVSLRTEADVSMQQDAARKLQRFFKKIIRSDRFIPVISRDQGHDDYNDIIPQTISISRSMNVKKQKELLRALEKGTWTDVIFSDRTLPQLAMSLFDKSLITRQQIYTLLEYYQTTKDYPLIEERFLPLLKTGTALPELTEVAESILIQSPIFQVSDASTRADQKKKLALLIATLPKSEQFCYITDISKAIVIDHLNSSSSDAAKDALLWNLSLITNVTRFYNYNKTKEINLSTGAREAFGLTMHGDNYAGITLRPGVLSIKDIEHGVRAGVRYGAIHYPTLSPPKILHGHKKITNHSITKHDVYHSEVMSTIPSNIKSGLFQCVDAIRVATGIQNSKETWTLIDGELTFYRANPSRTMMLKQDVTNAFCLLLCFGAGGKSDAGAGLLTPKDPNRTITRFSALIDGQPLTMNVLQCYELTVNNWNLTIAGACVILNMLEDPKGVWKSLGFDYTKIGDPFKFYTDHIQKIHHQIKGNSPQRQIAKIFLSLDIMTRIEDKDLQDTIIAYLFFKLDTIKDEKLVFSKQGKSTPQEIPQNTILLNGCQQFSLDNLKALMPAGDLALLEDLMSTQSQLKKQLPFQSAWKDLLTQNQKSIIVLRSHLGEQERLIRAQQERSNAATNAAKLIWTKIYDFFRICFNSLLGRPLTDLDTYAGIARQALDTLRRYQVQLDSIAATLSDQKKIDSKLNREIETTTSLERKKDDILKTMTTEQSQPSTTSPEDPCQEHAQSDVRSSLAKYTPRN